MRPSGVTCIGMHPAGIATAVPGVPSGPRCVTAPLKKSKLSIASPFCVPSGESVTTIGPVASQPTSTRF